MHRSSPIDPSRPPSRQMHRRLDEPTTSPRMRWRHLDRCRMATRAAVDEGAGIAREKGEGRQGRQYMKRSAMILGGVAALQLVGGCIVGDSETLGDSSDHAAGWEEF